MLWLWLLVAFVPIQNSLGAAIVDAGSSRDDEESQESGAFRESDRDTGARIPHIMEEAAIPGVISAGQPLQEFLELHQSDLQGTTSNSKEKRCKTSGYTYDLVGSSRSSLPTLHLTRRDLQSETLKRRCEICRESARCKKLGKCELCTQICERYEAAIREHGLDIQERDVHEDAVGIASRFGAGPDNSIAGLSELEDRYYTVGTFAPGPVYDLLTRALGIHSKDTIERFIVLAKAKTKGATGKPSRPVVIDTAHIFSVNEGRPKELDFEVHEVTSPIKDDIESLTSKVNSELDKAMESKRKMEEDPYLTPDEIDKVIEDAVAKPEPGEKPDIVGMSSRHNDGESMIKEDGEGETGKTTQIVGISSRNNSDESTVKTVDGDDNAGEGTTTTSPSSPSAIPSTEEASTTDGSKVDQIETETPQSAKGQETHDNSQSEESAESSEDAQNQNSSRPRTNEEYQQPAIPNRFGQPVFDAPQPEFQEVPNPQEHEQFNYISEPDNQYAPAIPNYSYQYSPKAYGPKTIIPSQPEPGFNEDETIPIYSSPKSTYSYQYSPKAYGPKTIIPSKPEPGFNEDESNPIYAPPKSTYSYQYSPKAYGPKTIIPSEPEPDDSNPIYVPEGVLTDDAYLGKPIENDFKEQYEDLKQWADENVGSAPPETPHQQPRIPQNLMHRVNAIIDGAASSAKTLNEKIAKLVKTKEDPEEQVVKLENMKEFATSFSPDQRSEIMDKKTDPVVASKKNPYDAHPRTESRYKGGKWTSEKLAPSKPPYPTKYEGRMIEIVGSQQPDGASNSEGRPFIDPKLLDMKSVVQDLKHVPGYFLQKAGEVADAFRRPPKIDPPPKEMNVPPVAMLLSRSNANETDEGVACSHEESDEYYREAEGAKQNGESVVGLAETREAEDVGASEEVKEGGQNGNETVACSKEKDEDDYELVHFKPANDYGGYRSSIKEELRKLHLPTSIDELVHPKAKSAKPDPSRKGADVKSTDPEKEVAKLIEDLNRMHKHGGHKPQANQIPESSEEVPPASNFGFNPMNSNDPNFPAMEERPAPPPWQVNAGDGDGEIIGSPPILENRFQHQNGENLTHLGKIIPAESHLHHRDVSDQIKPMYFLGDGIKLPLHMKQQGDGSLHLSVDVKKLCKCKHCNQKHAKEGDLGTIERSSDDVALTLPAPPEVQGNLMGRKEDEFLDNEEHDKTEITKRSPKAKPGGDSGELVAVFGENASNEIFNDGPTPIKRSPEGGKGRGLNLVKRKVGLVTDVLDWMKTVALDEARLHPKVK